MRQRIRERLDVVLDALDLALGGLLLIRATYIEAHEASTRQAAEAVVRALAEDRQKTGDTI